MGGSSWNCELPAGPRISCTITSFINMVLCASDVVLTLNRFGYQKFNREDYKDI
jgi:hypothetical protein